MTSKKLSISLALTVFACAGQTASRVPLAGPDIDPTPQPQTDLEFVTGSRRVAMESAIAWTTGGESIFVFLSSERVRCDALRTFNWPEDRAVSLQFTIGRRYSPDGRRIWEMGSYGLTGSARGESNVDTLDDARTSVIVEDTDLGKGGRVQLEIDVNSKPLNARGRINAVSCGRTRMRWGNEELAEVVPQATDIRLAGNPVTFQSSRFRTSEMLGRVFEMSTLPLSCNEASGADADVNLKLILDGQGYVMNATVYGALLAPGGYDHNFDGAKPLRAEPLENGRVRLSGSANLKGMPLALGGVATARECPKRP